MIRKSTRPLAPRKSLTDSVYERLQGDIVNGLIKPDELMFTGRIAKAMQVSPMPVRAAMTRLQAEGLVSIAPHRGVRVTSISPEEMEEAYAIRSRLESFAVCLACPNLSEGDIAQLRRFQQEMLRAEQKSDVKGWLKANERFHQLIFEASGNRKLGRLILDLWNDAKRGRTGARNIPGHMERRNAEHAGLLKALMAKDWPLAERLMLEHVIAAGREIAGFISEQYAGERNESGGHASTGIGPAAKKTGRRGL